MSSSQATCELCRVEAASFYCHSDAASLCSTCDRHVHSANFLSARHVRHPLPVDSGRSCRGILVNWGRKLGLGEWTARVVGRACGVMRLMSGGNSNHYSRLRVWLAASFWFGMRMCGPRVATWRNLKGLEEVSCVPANLIAAVGSKLQLALTRRNISNSIGNGRKRLDLDLEEGWAESSV